MGLESATYIADLVSTNPSGSDGKNAGDDHIRLLKSVLKNSFPNINAAASATDEEISGLHSPNDLFGIITMGTNWIRTGPPTTARMHKLTLNLLVLEGFVYASAASPGSTIMTLPAGYRPSVDLYFPAVFEDASTGEKHPCQIKINATTGAIVPQSLTGHTLPAYDTSDEFNFCIAFAVGV